MNLKINYIRLIICILIIALCIFLIVNYISRSNSGEDVVKNNTSGDTKPIIISNEEVSGEKDIQKLIESSNKRFTKIKEALETCEYFSESTKTLESGDVIQLLNLEQFNDLSCLVMIDESGDAYQEVVVVVSPHEEDYDELVRSMILRYQTIKENYFDKYGDELKDPECLSIKQEFGVVSLIVSNNMKELLKIVRAAR